MPIVCSSNEVTTHSVDIAHDVTKAMLRRIGDIKTPWSGARARNGAACEQPHRARVDYGDVHMIALTIAVNICLTNHRIMDLILIDIVAVTATRTATTLHLPLTSRTWQCPCRQQSWQPMLQFGILVQDALLMAVLDRQRHLPHQCSDVGFTGQASL